MSNGFNQANPQINEHKFALFILKQKGYGNTNGVEGKWKVLRVPPLTPKSKL
jgi:hypothetical protein